MTAYYTGMIYLTCFAMGIMALIVHSSDWLDREKQRQFQVIFATVAAAAGADGLMIEVHDRPEEALSDGRQALTCGEFARLARRVQALTALLRQEE